LKDENKKKKAAAKDLPKPPPPEVAKGKAQVQVPASRPAAGQRDDDATPPPTRNPLLKDEPKVQVAESLMEEAANSGEHTDIKQPLRQGQPPPRPSQGAAPRPAPGQPPQNRGVPPKR
jgi:hypothetical protein